MMLRSGMTRELFRDVSRMVADARHPQCYDCGAETLLLDILDQPVYGEPDKGLVQYSCTTCNIIIEELRPIGNP